MEFRIDHSLDRPTYLQIVVQVKRDIAFGKLHHGEKLPTVRQLALELAINPNTIAKAYKLLERDGVIVTRPGAGAFVAEIKSDLNNNVKKRILAAELERVAVDAFHMQFGRANFKKLFEEIVKKIDLP